MGTAAYQQYPTPLNTGDFDTSWRLLVHNSGGTGEGAAAITTVASKLMLESIREETGVSYTLALTDANKTIEFNNAAAIAVQIPLNATVAFPIGTAIGGIQIGAGQVTVSGAGGVTIRNADKKTLRQYSRFSMVKVRTDTWDVFGELTS
jgi:hypothetical protein